jgi:hypothetical protein
MFIQAGEDDTKINDPNGNVVTLNMGESIVYRVNQDDTTTSDKPIQVDLITGDINSNYEIRWFSLLPTEKYAKNYLSPLGDTEGKSKVLCFHSSDEQISVTYEYLVNKELQAVTMAIQPHKHILTSTIPTESGCRLSSDSVFLALSFTDTEYYDDSLQRTYGQAYDWGFPVMPYRMLTPQVLIGFGFGCTYNACNQKIMSAVWVSPVKDATIYIVIACVASLTYQRVPCTCLPRRLISNSILYESLGLR